jgi:hypothetical protein
MANPITPAKTRVSNNIYTGHTQESVVGVRLKEFLGPVEQEAEREENLDVGALLEKTLIDVSSVLQLVDAYGVSSSSVAYSVQWVQNLKNTDAFK